VIVRGKLLKNGQVFLDSLDIDLQGPQLHGGVPKWHGAFVVPGGVALLRAGEMHIVELDDGRKGQILIDRVQFGSPSVAHFTGSSPLQ
jgi:hypothetical protein